MAPILPQTSSPAELELRMAKLWARVDELESLSIQQRERLKLLEKGLMLGIIPDELKEQPRVQTAKDHGKAKTSEVTPEQPPASAAPGGETKAEEAKSQDLAAYRRALQHAQDKFNAAQYGQAIVGYNQIGETFADALTEGSQHYWVGLSWYYLKEFQLAEQSFQVLQQKHPQNPWIAHARFYRAKIDQSRGLNQRALEQLTQLLEEFPNQDLGEMAKMEIERLRERL